MKSSTRRDSQLDVEQVAQRPAPGRGRTSSGAGPVALLIAGNPDDSEVYARRLRADGYRVVPATGVQRGLDRAAAARPDVVFVCLGPWAVPALMLHALRSDTSTRGLPTVLVSDLTRPQLAVQVGGLLTTENVVPRTAAVRDARQERALTGRPAGCGQRAGWEQWLRR
jgi:CheY-like chemotaxis protein